MRQSRRKAYPLSEKPLLEKKRRRREYIIIFAIVIVVALLTLIEFKVIGFGSQFPISNTIPMFILININLLLLVLLFFLVFRNLVKLLYERRRRVMGSKLRTRLVIAFVSLTLLPTTVLFFFAINFITTSVEFWFNVPVEKALENSLKVGRQIYAQAEKDNRFFIERIVYQINVRNLLNTSRRIGLENYIQIVQRSFNLDAVEVYSADFKRLTFSAPEDLVSGGFVSVSADDLKRTPREDQVLSIKNRIRSGELIRSISTVPLDTATSEIKGYAVATRAVPLTLTRHMRSITKGTEEYQQIKLLKRPIQSTYYITLSIVALLAVFCAVWFGFYLAKSISVPIQELGEGTRRVAEGDLTYRIDRVGDDEIGSLVDSFNRMTRDLQIGRTQLEQSSNLLQEQNLELDQRRRYMSIVLQNISAGIISMDAAGVITTMNTAAEKMLAVPSGHVVNKTYQSVLKGRHLDLTEEVLNDLENVGHHTVQMPLRLVIKGALKSFLVHVSMLRSDAGKRLGTVVVFDDLTELEKAQRVAAWREVARRIAHEVKNPLTPISLSAQRLQRKYSDLIGEPLFDECTRMIIDHVEMIRNLVNEFSEFARFPAARPKPCNLAPIIEESVMLYREAHPEIDFQVGIQNQLPELDLDRQQIKQALSNLINNAIFAIRGKGVITVTAKKMEDSKQVCLTVTDNGKGFQNKDRTRIFEPNFSTKISGMGLGLTIVHSIVTDHGGKIRALDNQPKGAKFVIELPV